MPIPVIPENFLCKINHTIMFDPVIAEDGFTYERQAIEQWFAAHNTSPMTREIIGNRLTSNRDTKALIIGFLDDNAKFIHEAIETSIQENDNLEFINALIKRNSANLDRQDENRQTPLHIAVINRKPNIIQLLLQAGADYKIKNNQHQNPKKTAKELGYWDLVEIIEQEIKTIDRMKLTEMRQQLEEISQAQIAQLQQENEQLRRELMERVDNIHMPDITPLTIQYQNLQQRTAYLEQPVACEFLKHAAFGEQDEAEAMLRSQPNLALAKGTLTDCAGRTFQQITGFQYALWALDWHMWKMILRYLPEEEARRQVEGLNNGEWVAEHGTQVSWQNLIDALQIYISNYNQNTALQNRIRWSKQVGKAQLMLPAHVINEYSREDRSFFPCPAFNETILPRTSIDLYGKVVSATNWQTSPNGKLGDDFAWGRSKEKGLWAAIPSGGMNGNTDALYMWGVGGAEGPPSDMLALSTLFVVRVEQRVQLIASIDHGARPQPNP